MIAKHSRMSLTTDTCRAARGLLNWSSDRLANEAGVGVATVQRFERGDVATNQSTVAMLQRALEAAGVEFIPENGGGAGVRLRSPPPRKA
jgi:transcriptional regulator with XRE-family HTH domain